MGTQNPLTNFAIEVGGEYAGGIGLTLESDVFYRSAEIGYWLGEPFWGGGIATAAVRTFTKFAFDNFDLLRIFANVFAWNPASGHVLEKAGYLREGVMRQCVCKQGEVTDAFLYAITRDMKLSASATKATNVLPANTPSTNANVQIRRAEPADLEAIAEIYNEAILTTTATFDTQPKTAAERLPWFQTHDAGHPILVAMIDGQVVGWSSLTRWSDRPAYNGTAEVSFYVKSEFRGRGLGRLLKGAIIDEARRLKFHTLIARVAEGSNESLHLNECFGFKHVGTMKQVGRKFGRLLDVQILQLMLD